MSKGFDLRRELYDWAQALVAALLVFIVLFAFVARVIGVEGPSMDPTLHTGQKLLITNLLYTPNHGDIIMFTKRGADIPGHATGSPLVKRIIGLPGDEIDIDFINHTVSVNGKVLDEPYIQAPTSLQYDVSFPITVPENCVFVMGDNRNVSLDSRDSRVGMIDKRYILGHVLLRVFPIQQFGLVK